MASHDPQLAKFKGGLIQAKSVLKRLEDLALQRGLPALGCI
jgi:hypothetical protein